MQTEALINAENLLSEIYVMIAAQRGNETIDSDLIFKLNALNFEFDPVLREVRYNKREIEHAAFIRYRADLTRAFTNIIKSVDGLLQRHQIAEAEYIVGGPDGFDINNDYTVTDAQQFLHSFFTCIDGAIDREFSEQEADVELPELHTINEKILLLRHTGAYKLLYELCDTNQTKTARLISSLIGEDEKAIRISISYINRPNKIAHATPYTIPAMSKIINLLTLLQLPTDELLKIYTDILNRNEKL